MSKTRIIRCALIVFLLLSSITFAETQKMKEHKVVRGDTLWDITETELADPFRWPEVWKVNPWIKNPHWIYPKQIIKIPLYLLKKEKLAEELAKSTAASPEPAATEPEVTSLEPAKEEVKKEAARITRHPLIDRNKLIASGYIADKIPGVGQVIDSPSGQVLFGNNDIIYVDVDNPVHAEDKFYVFKTSKRIKHPITGEKIGYVISICGIVEIVKVKQGEITAKITKIFREIDKGDRLDPYYDIETPMTTGHFRSPDIKGTIVATGNGFKWQSMLDTIYIDKGFKDGIETGDIFMTSTVDDTQVLPNGVIQVISCREHTATVIIKSSRLPVSPGDIFSKLGKYSGK